MKLSGAVFLLLGATVESLLSSEREFFLVDYAETFSGAYCHCLQHGTTLAGFRDDMDLEQASSLCPNRSVWIGLYRQGRSWVWVSGDSYRIERWSPGDRSSYPCVVMQNGLWHPENCLQRNPFVCYKGSAGALPLILRLLLNCPSKPVQVGPLTPSAQSTKTETSPVSDDSISASWITMKSELFSSVMGVLGGSKPEQSSSAHVPSSHPLTQEEDEVTSAGFQSNQHISSMPQTPLITVTPLWNQRPVIIRENRTWFEAAAACQTRGQLLARRVTLQQGVKAWLGLHRHGLYGYWVWADGSTVEEPQNWGAGEPSNPIGGNCGAGTGTEEEGVIWEDECCSVKLYYVCE